MRALTVDELSFVSGGLADPKSDPPVVVTAPRRPPGWEPAGGWNLWENMEFVSAWIRFNEIEAAKEQMAEEIVLSVIKTFGTDWSVT